MDHSIPFPKGHKKVEGDSSGQVLGITTVLMSIMEMIERLDSKVDRIGEGLLVQVG